MRVIVQDIQTKQFLAANGRWVVDRESAADFITIMRAYRFARHNTARHFQVVLHSPDDNYTANIIGGMGVATSSSIPIESAPAPVRCRTARRHCSRFVFPAAYSKGRDFLN